MWDRWVGKQVNLNALAELLKKFFEGKPFRVSVENASTGYKIAAYPKLSAGLLDVIEVFVRGKPDDFVIEFVPGSNTRKSIRSGFLTYLFGGGLLWREGLKSQEELDKLEREFWNFVDMKLPSLEQKQV